MENLTKVCSKCKVEKGADEFRNICDRVKKNGVKTIRSNRVCNKCCNNYNQARRANNKEKCKEQNKRYYHIHKEKNKEKKKVSDMKYRISDKGLISQKKGRDKWNANNHEKRSKTFQNMRDNLTDGIVRGYLKKRGGCPEELLYNPEIIEIKRLIIQTKRLCKI